MKGILIDNETNDVVLRGTPRGMVLGDESEIAAQAARLLFLAEKGELKEIPMRGVGMSRFMEDHTPERLMREIRREAFEEGLEISQLAWQEGKLELDINYKKDR